MHPKNTREEKDSANALHLATEREWSLPGPFRGLALVGNQGEVALFGAAN